MKMYNDIAVENDTQVDLSNIKVNKLYLLNTNPTDLIVPYEDAEIVYNQTTLIDEEDKRIVPIQIEHITDYYYYWHTAQTTDEDIGKEIKERLR